MCLYAVKTFWIQWKWHRRRITEDCKSIKNFTSQHVVSINRDFFFLVDEITFQWKRIVITHQASKCLRIVTQAPSTNQHMQQFVKSINLWRMIIQSLFLAHYNVEEEASTQEVQWHMNDGLELHLVNQWQTIIFFNYEKSDEANCNLFKYFVIQTRT